MRSSLVERPPLLQGLPPIGDDQARVLILGSFPSEASLREQQYYAHPRNNFWPLMEALFGIRRHASYRDRVEGLLKSGVAVWDVIGRCRRSGSADQAIQGAEPNDLPGWLADHASILGIAFNGAKAEDTARKSVPDLFGADQIETKRLPSTSPAHASMSLADKVEAWRQIKEWARGDA